MDRNKSRVELIRHTKLLYKKIPVFFISLLCLLSFLNFIYLFFISEDRENLLEAATSDFFSRRIFIISFFAFFLIFLLSSLILFFVKNFYLQLAAYIMCLSSSAIIYYSTGQLIFLKLFIYLAFLICILFALPKKYNYIVSFFTLIVIIFVEIFFYNNFDEDLCKSSLFELINFIISVSFLYSIAFIYCILCSLYFKEKETVDHVSTVMVQLSEINSHLQNYAKNCGKEAEKNERIRITRDMHDSCGYSFVNIIAILDAIMSNPNIPRDELSDTLLTVRNLASKGLRETRETLHLIRKIEYPAETNINALFETQKVFMAVTGINVEMIPGNIKNDYGTTINSIVIHALQESLTNAVRHGRAKNITVALYEDEQNLRMTVTDDGIGSDEIIKGIGFAGMEERLEKVCGKLEISSPKSGGFRVQLEIPLIRAEGLIPRPSED